MQSKSVLFSLIFGMTAVPAFGDIAVLSSNVTCNLKNELDFAAGSPASLKTTVFPVVISVGNSIKFDFSQTQAVDLQSTQSNKETIASIECYGTISASFSQALKLKRFIFSGFLDTKNTAEVRYAAGAGMTSNAAGQTDGFEKNEQSNTFDISEQELNLQQFENVALCGTDLSITISQSKPLKFSIKKPDVNSSSAISNPAIGFGFDPC